MLSRLFGYGLVVLLVICCAERQAPAEAGDALLGIQLRSGGSDGFGGELVQMEAGRELPRFHLVAADGNKIPVQFNKIDQVTNSLIFYSPIPANQTQVLRGIAGEVDFTGPSLTHSFNIEGSKESITEWTSDMDPLNRGGVIVANEWLAYRVARGIDAFALPKNSLADVVVADLDKANLVDAPTTNGFVGMGLYNYDGIVELGEAARLELKLVESGPVRAKVQVNMLEIPVRKEFLDIQVEYVFYVGKPFADISMELVSKTDLNLKFAVGLARNPVTDGLVQGVKENAHFAYTFGTQTADGLYSGAALIINDPYKSEVYNDDPDFHFLLVDPIEDEVKFRSLCLYSGDASAISDEMEFVGFLRNFALSYGRPSSATIVD